MHKWQKWQVHPLYKMQRHRFEIYLGKPKPKKVRGILVSTESCWPNQDYWTGQRIIHPAIVLPILFWSSPCLTLWHFKPTQQQLPCLVYIHILLPLMLITDNNQGYKVFIIFIKVSILSHYMIRLYKKHLIITISKVVDAE